MTHHPIRDHAIKVYTSDDGAIALIGDGKVSFPYFRGETAQEAREKAEAFVEKTIAENEAAFIARQEAAAKARYTRAAKEAMR